MKFIRCFILLLFLLFSMPITTSAVAIMPDNPIKILTHSNAKTDYYIFANSLNTASDDINDYISFIMTKEDKDHSGIVMECLTYKFERATKHFYFRFDYILAAAAGEEPKEIKTSLIWHDLEPLMQSEYAFSLYEALQYGKQHRQ